MRPRFQIACHDEHTIILHRPTGKVYVTGSNRHGQLYLGFFFKKATVLQQIHFPPEIKIKAINSEYYLTFAFDTNSKRHTWGYDRYPNFDTELSPEQKSFISEEYIPYKAIGRSNYQLFLCKDNNLYIKGNNKFMGIFPPDGLKQLQFNGRIIQIGSAFHHSFVLTTTGLYSWGKNLHGVLGLGNTTNRDSPTRINLNNIVSFSIGSAHTVSLDNKNHIWVWGFSGCGQLGLGYHDKYSPTKLSLQNIISVACGHEHTMALDTEENVYVWGRNNCGQLGLGDLRGTPIPTKLSFGNIVSIECGGFHTVMVNTKDQIYVWGKNSEGQLGLVDDEDRYVPHPLKFEFGI